jgi:hypothetical protein
MRAAELILLTLYFRGVVDPVLRGSIAIAGLVGLAAHRDLASLLVFLATAIIAFCLPNGLEFAANRRIKGEVLAFLEHHRGAVFRPVPVATFRGYFDIDFLIPSFIRPEWFLKRFADSRIHVFVASRGSARSPLWSPRAFVSPIALDVYVFLRTDPDTVNAQTHFQVAHELGHAAAIYSASAKRNLIGVSCVFLSILWTVAVGPWTPALLGWTMLQLAASLWIGRTVFGPYRRRQRFNAETIADYMALRHLPDWAVAELVEGGEIESLVQPDPALSEAQTAERRSLVVDCLRRRARGEPIEIPQYYLDETFRHPPALVLFLFLHLGYLAYFALRAEPGPWTTLAFLVPAIAFYLVQAAADAAGRVAISRTLDGEPPAAA